MIGDLATRHGVKPAPKGAHCLIVFKSLDGTCHTAKSFLDDICPLRCGDAASFCKAVEQRGVNLDELAPSGFVIGVFDADKQRLASIVVQR